MLNYVVQGQRIGFGMGSSLGHAKREAAIEALKNLRAKGYH